MIRIIGMTRLVLFVVIASGCKQEAGTVVGTNMTSAANATPADSIRAAINAHVAHNGNLRPDAFDTEVKQLTLNGDHAQAQVEFRAKNGPGTMQLTYSLEKRDGAWVVAESTPSGSNFSHPTAGMPAQDNGAMPGGNTSVFDALDKMHDHANAGTAKLPPGHPPVNSDSSASGQQP